MLPDPTQPGGAVEALQSLRRRRYALTDTWRSVAVAPITDLPDS